MNTSGQIQTVPRDALECKLGHKLALGDRFKTTTGTWKVIDIGVDDATKAELITIERDF